jgi:hypothetical protein
MQNPASPEFFWIWQQRIVDCDWRSAVLRNSNAMCGELFSFLVLHRGKLIDAIPTINTISN